MEIRNIYRPFELDLQELDQYVARPHKNTFFEMLFVLEGEGLQMVNDHELPYGANKLFLIFPRDRHGFEVKKPSRFFFIRFNDSYLKTQSPEWVRKMEFIFHNHNHLPGCILKNLTDKPLIRSLVEAIIQEDISRHPDQQGVIAQLINTIITIAARNVSIMNVSMPPPGQAALTRGQTAPAHEQKKQTHGQETISTCLQTASASGQTAPISGQTASTGDQTTSISSQTASSEGLTVSISSQTASTGGQTVSTGGQTGIIAGQQAGALLNYVHQHIYQPEKLKIEEIAGHFHLSPSYIGEYFKRQTGESLQQYVMRYKVNLVETRLRYTSLRLNEIVAEFGFSDLSHLNRLFKKYKGINPTDYRKQCKDIP